MPGIALTPPAGHRSGGAPDPPEPDRRSLLAVATGAPIGLLGGLIGLGGAEFRLPVLKAVFGYGSRRAVPANLCVSLITVGTALAVRLGGGGGDGALDALAPPIAGLAAGAVAGAWLGAAFAARISAARLERLIFVLLAGLGVGLVAESFVDLAGAGLPLGRGGRVAAGATFGIGIGWVSSVLGVAGGELLIPTLVFAFGADVKLAGTGSLLVSLPALCVGLGRYGRAGLLPGRAELRAVVAPMGAGSVAGAAAGALLLPYVAAAGLKAVLGVILLISAYRTFAR